MATRNFWVEADIDGRETMLNGGPANKEGGMEVNIYQRSDGYATKALKVVCRERNGNLTTEVYDKYGNLKFSYGTNR